MQDKPNIRCRLLNLDSEGDAVALTHLIDAYAADPMGRGKALDAQVRERLARGLSRVPTARVVVAEVDGQPLGIVVCFVGYSTFGGAPLLNVHDCYVAKEWRRVGVGRQLIHAVCALAQREQCCKVTLEVREDNQVAQALYKSEGFGDGQPSMLFWIRTVE